MKKEYVRNTLIPGLALATALSLGACSSGEGNPDASAGRSGTIIAPHPSETCDPSTERLLVLYTGYFAVRYTGPAGEISDEKQAVRVTDDAAATLRRYDKATNIDRDTLMVQLTATGTPEHWQQALKSDPNAPNDPMLLLLTTESDAIASDHIVTDPPRIHYQGTTAVVPFTTRPDSPPVSGDEGYMIVQVNAHTSCRPVQPSVNPSDL